MKRIDRLSPEALENTRRSDRIYQHKRRLARKGFKTKEYEKWRTNNPLAYEAHKKLHWQITCGKIKKQPCEVCGEKNTHAHHPDYSKPFEVMWLCPIHHKLEHQRVDEKLLKKEN